MNHKELEYLQGLEKQLAELEAKEKLFSHKTINERLDTLESQVCEAKNGLSETHWARLLIKQLPENHDGRNTWLLNHEDKQPDGTTLCPSVNQIGVTSTEVCNCSDHLEMPNVTRCSICHKSLRSSGEKKWKPILGETYYYINDRFNSAVAINYNTNYVCKENCFRTRELAEQFLSKIKALREV